MIYFNAAAENQYELGKDQLVNQLLELCSGELLNNMKSVLKVSDFEVYGYLDKIRLSKGLFIHGARLQEFNNQDANYLFNINGFVAYYLDMEKPPYCNIRSKSNCHSVETRKIPSVVPIQVYFEDDESNPTKLLFDFRYVSRQNYDPTPLQDFT